MPAVLSLLLGLLVGVSFAWAAADELSSQQVPSLSTRAMLVTVLWSLLVFGPSVAYFAFFEPAWFLGYLLNPARVPSAVLLAVALLAAGAVPVGFWGASWWVKQRRFRLLFQLSSIPAVLFLVGVLIAGRRLGTYATFPQFHGNFGTETLAGTPLGYALAAILGVITVSAGLIARQLKRFAEGLRSGS